MVEGKFDIPKELSESKLVQLIEDVRIKVSELSGIEVNIDVLKPQITGGYNTTTYVIKGNGVKVSIRYNHEAARVDRANKGLVIYVGAEQEKKIYETIVDIFRLNEHKLE